MLIKKRGRKPKNTTVPLVKSDSPYGNIYKVVPPKKQKIKPTTKFEDTPHERVSKATIGGQNRTFKNQGRKN